MQKEQIASSRTVVPKWRSLLETPSNELRLTPTSKPQEPDSSPLYREKLAEWEETKSPENAISLVEAALRFGGDQAAKDAAESIVQDATGISDSVKQLAFRYLDATQLRRVARNQDAAKPGEAVARLKARLRDHPRDAIACLEIARLHLSHGQLQKAGRYVVRAVQTCPNHRYILRAAACYFHVINEQDAGLHYIRRSDLVRTDPWVQSAEVSLSDVLGKSPRWGATQIKRLKTLQRGEIASSELAAGLATLELKEGSRKSARRLFKTSVMAPTSSSLAQVRWAQAKGHIPDEFTVVESSVYRAYEAAVYRALSNDKPLEAVRAAEQWLTDEPFQVSAAITASSLYTSVFADYDSAIQVADRGLLAMPNDLILRNNKLVALARRGDVDEARAILPKLEPMKNISELAPFYYGAHGLVAFAAGSFHFGRDFYHRAIEVAKERKDYRRMFLALAHWWEQEALNGLLTKEESEKVGKSLDEIWKTSKDARIDYSDRKSVV